MAELFRLSQMFKVSNATDGKASGDPEGHDSQSLLKYKPPKATRKVVISVCCMIVLQRIFTDMIFLKRPRDVSKLVGKIMVNGSAQILDSLMTFSEP